MRSDKTGTEHLKKIGEKGFRWLGAMNQHLGIIDESFRRRPSATIYFYFCKTFSERW